jgi:hypothetical protein
VINLVQVACFGFALLFALPAARRYRLPLLVIGWVTLDSHTFLLRIPGRERARRPGGRAFRRDGTPSPG